MAEENSIIWRRGQKHSGGFFKLIALLAVTCVIYLGVSALIVSANSGNRYITGAATPEQAVEQYVEKTYPAYADTYNLLLMQEYNQLAVVLYELPGDSTDKVYYQVVAHDGTAWYIDDKWEQGRGNHLAYYSGLRSHVKLTDSYVHETEKTIFYGKTLDDDVVAVEVYYGHSGQTTRVGVKDGLFVIVSPSQDRRAGAMRALDADGNVLAELD